MDTPEKPDDVLLTITPASGKPGRFVAVASCQDQELARDNIDLNSAPARNRFLSAALKAMPGLNGKTDAFRAYLADRLLAAAKCPPGTAEPASADTVPADADPRAEELAKMSPEVRAAAEELLESPNLWPNILRDIREVGVVGENDLAGCVYAIGTSRELPKPLAGIIRGPSSSGKSYIVNTVATLFPPECLIHASQMTPQALFHMRPGSLSHRWIVAGERSRREEDEQADCTRALREMISERRLTKLMPMKTPGGTIETVQLVQDGPIAFTETTTLAKVFDEDQNRALVLVTDERRTQTANIIAAFAEAAAGIQTADVVRIRAVHHALQRMLPRCDVVVPFAVAVGKLFNKDRVEARREFPHLLQLVKAVTLLHFKQRDWSEGRLVATLDDYETAEGLARVPLASAASGVGEGAMRFLDELKGAYHEKTFTTRDARKLSPGSGKRTVETWLSELEECGLVKQVEASRGRIPAKWELDNGRASQQGAPPRREEVETEFCKGRTAAHMRTDGDAQ